MSLPNFIVVGAQRCGTTWLYDVLKSQNNVYLPEERKELHFFDNNFDKGLDWYRGFYRGWNGEKLVGDITPRYLYDEQCAGRIFQALGNVKIVVLIREPVDRMISQFGLYVRDRGLSPDDFDGFINSNPDAVLRGMYSEQIKRYFKVFGKNNVLILNFDRVVSEPNSVVSDLSDFLDTDLDYSSPIKNKSNSSYIPKWQWGYAFAKSFGDYLRKLGLDLVVEKIKKTRFRALFGKSEQRIRIDNSIKEKYSQLFHEDILKTQTLTGLSLENWLKRYEN